MLHETRAMVKPSWARKSSRWNISLIISRLYRLMAYQSGITRVAKNYSQSQRQWAVNTSCIGHFFIFERYSRNCSKPDTLPLSSWLTKGFATILKNAEPHFLFHSNSHFRWLSLKSQSRGYKSKRKERWKDRQWYQDLARKIKKL